MEQRPSPWPIVWAYIIAAALIALAIYAELLPPCRV